MLDDVDRLLGEVKRLVENSLCDMKLCADDKAPKVMLGENVQTALSMHEGPWYMEQPKHVPGEFHKILGIQPSVVSPRSDSTNPPTALFAGKNTSDNAHISKCSTYVHPSMLQVTTIIRTL